MSAVGSRWGTAFSRWKYRFVSWFFDKPDALSRRVKVENELIEHFSNHTSPTPEACFEMAKKLGVPTWAKRVRM
jgi:hypothetical protein